MLDYREVMGNPSPDQESLKAPNSSRTDATQRHEVKARTRSALCSKLSTVRQ